ncbi:MAG: thiamine-phosphate kinase, partial [Lentisphaeria bacterium]
MDELKFLKQLLPRIHQSSPEIIVGPGDDCAAVLGRNNMLQLLAVDQVVLGKHYLPDTAANLVGRKLLARNLSDIAAMGGIAKFALATSAADSSWSEGYHLELMDGILELASLTNVAIIGGDVAGLPSGFVATLTITGEVSRDEILLRSTAKPGDMVFVTGLLGDSFKTEHHLHFRPRLEEGRFLASEHFATACMDISDGLLMDVTRLAKASNCSVTLDINQLPARSVNISVEQMLCDGEDYELLFTVSPE